MALLTSLMFINQDFCVRVFVSFFEDAYSIDMSVVSKEKKDNGGQICHLVLSCP